MKEREMVEVRCPWCEAELPMALEIEADSGSCSECLTTWRYEETAETALAA